MGAIMLMCEEGMSSGYLPQEKLATGIEKKNHTIVKYGAVPGWGEATGSGAEGWAEEENWRSHKRQPPAASAHSPCPLPPSLCPSVPRSLHCPCTMGPALGPSLLLVLLTSLPLALGDPM